MGMQLKKIMTPEVECIHKDASVRDVAQRMKAIDAGTASIYDCDRLVEMITDREFTLHVVAEGRDITKTLAHNACPR
jgi:CBS domain-containing protein